MSKEIRTARLRVIRHLEALAAIAGERSHDRFWSNQRHNVPRWAQAAYDDAIDLVRCERPAPGEAKVAYFHRVLDKLRSSADLYRMPITTPGMPARSTTPPTSSNSAS